MTRTLALCLLLTGCTCVCHTETDFTAACQHTGGRVQQFTTTIQLCTTDAGIVATWIGDDSGTDETTAGAEPPP